MRVAILGGSFDPVHEGHLLMAKKAYQQLNLDEVWFLPANDAPLKERILSTYSHRLRMLERMLAPYRHFKINCMEENREGKNYTIDTIRELKKSFPNNTFFFLMGADQVSQLDKWKDVDALEKEVQLCAFVRDGVDIKTPYNVHKLCMEEHPASSSAIRNGKFSYVNKSVRRYILENEMYFDFVKNCMSKYRYEHSIRVANLAVHIAKCNRLDVKRAYLCGLFHDLNKEFQCISKEASEPIIRIMKPELLSLPEGVWHGYMARFILEHQLYIYDKKLLEAIENHVLGECCGSYAKLLYVADKLDPQREYDSLPLIKACCYSLNEGYELVRKEQKEFYGEENANGK